MSGVPVLHVPEVYPCALHCESQVDTADAHVPSAWQVPEEHPHCEHLLTRLPLLQYFGLVDEHCPYKVPSLHVFGDV